MPGAGAVHHIIAGVPTPALKEADACRLLPAKSLHADPPCHHSLPSIASRGRPLAHRDRVSCQPLVPTGRGSTVNLFPAPPSTLLRLLCRAPDSEHHPTQ